MRRCPIIVGYEEELTLLARWMPTVRMEEPETTYWCAACASEVSFDADPQFVRLKPLYRTGDLPGACCKCGITLRELGEMLS